jgi:hypothetical protein
VKELASKLQMSPDTIVLALLASWVITTIRLAARFARFVFLKASTDDIERLKETAIDKLRQCAVAFSFYLETVKTLHWLRPK